MQDVLAQLSARLDKLEQAQLPAPVAPVAPIVPPATIPGLDADTYWLLHKLAASKEKSGEVVYGGLVTAPTGEQYMWQRGAAVQSLFKSDWASLDKVLAALAHPVRLRLLKLILDGKRTKAELETLADIGTTGQLYHH